MVGGKSGVIEVNLPDLVLRDLSSKGGVDVLTSEISGVVLGSVMEAVLAANIEGLGADVIGGLRGAVERVAYAGRGQLRALKKVAGGVGRRQPHPAPRRVG